MADTASTRAASSSRALATLVRAVVQQGSGSGTAALDAVLNEQSSTELLARLSTADRISALTGNMSEIRTRVERDRERAATLQAEFATAQAATETFPVAQKQDALATAEMSLSQATDAYALAGEIARAALYESAQASADRTTEATGQLAGMLGARLSDQGWATPAVGRLSDGYGPRPDLPLPGVEPFHAGTDVAAACGSAVYAASTGVITQTGRLGTYGNWVLIDHGDGVATGYAHLADGATLVSVGDSVTVGQVISAVGSTGASTGCHLHVEVRIDGAAVDPRPFFADRGIGLGAG